MWTVANLKNQVMVRVFGKTVMKIGCGDVNCLLEQKMKKYENKHESNIYSNIELRSFSYKVLKIQLAFVIQSINKIVTSLACAGRMWLIDYFAYNGMKQLYCYASEGLLW